MAEGLCIRSRLLFQPPGRLVLFSVHKCIQAGSTELSPGRSHTQLCHLMAANLGFSTQNSIPLPSSSLSIIWKKEFRNPQTSETSEVNQFTHKEENQTTVNFAAQDHRAGESEPWHARDSKATFSKQTKHSSWVI